MLATLESYFHRLRRRLSRAERAVRQAGLSVAENCGEEPGLLLIQIGGLSRARFDSTRVASRMPFHRRLRERENYPLFAFDPGRPAASSSVQSEIYSGCAVPGGSKGADDLLKGGSSWGNFHGGGAAPEECHFGIAGTEPALECERKRDPSRRQAITSGATIDLVRGLPIIHIRLADYEEAVRQHGPGSVMSGRALHDIDHSVRALTVEAHRSQRRDYHVWIFSDGLENDSDVSGLAPDDSAAERQDAPGFLLVPPATWLPGGGRTPLRPSDLRAAVLAALGRETRERATTAAVSPGRLTVMSYNVHSCIGMDGRISPRRIARVIARQHVDLVALQELDHGRARSRAEDQAGSIAEDLGFHLLFCPAVVRGDERYGHALLSRWPIETVKIDFLPFHPGGVWPEPRAAIWARVRLPDTVINVLSTHLGLAAPERMKQMTAILGPDWIGPVLDREPVILCGDFNLTPGSAAHRLASTRLRDVAHEFKRGVRTFSSIRLVAQLDHIFISPHFAPESVFAAQNDLTRVASDHLPLIAHLRLPGK